MLFLSVSSSFGVPRPLVRLAAGTLVKRMDALDPADIFADLNGFLIGLVVIHEGEVALPESPTKAGRVGHRRKDALVTTDIRLDERVLPGGAGNIERLAQFTDRIAAALEVLCAWCDRREAWRDRTSFDTAWSAVASEIRRGDLIRPYEFAATARDRDALDASWAAAWDLGPENARLEKGIRRYLDIRDRAWQGAEYEADPTAEAGRWGQPCLVSNFADNIATARPPDPSIGFSLY